MSEVDHPAYILGRQTWHPGMSLHDLADRIQHGYAPAGWEGDPRLTLALHTDPKTGVQVYELWRQEQGGYSKVATLPAERDPYGIIDELVARDFRRGLDLKESVDRHNAKIDAEKQEKADEQISDAADRLVHALRKDGAL